jgi:elongation factor 1 alpha-like protein
VPEPRLVAALDAAARAGATVDGRHPGELHLVILGHVDAGKSTLTGRLLADVGAVPGRSAAALARAATAAGKGSFGWAWILDASEDERARGVTVDVAAARFGPTRHWACVALADAPGHRDFVPAAMTGAAAADAAVLVVDGTPGGFEAGFSGGGGGGGGAGAGGFGQTREHAALARALGVGQVIVAVTKLDGLSWPADRFAEVRAVLGPFLASLGFPPSRTQWLPVSAPDGQNVSAPPTDERLASWWGGGRGGVEPGGASADDPFPTLLSAIDALSPVPRESTGPLRLPVSDVGKGPRGTVTLAGRLAAGAVCPGMRVVVVPGGATATVDSVATVSGGGGGDGPGGGGASALSLSPSPLAVAGQGAEVCLAGLPGPEAVSAGCVVCPSSAPAPAWPSFTARLVVMDTPGAPPLLRGASVTLHAHAAREAAVVTGLVALVDPATGQATRAKPRLVQRGACALVTIAPARPVSLDPECKGLARIALRDGGRTVAVGVVVGGVGD